MRLAVVLGLISLATGFDSLRDHIFSYYLINVKKN